MFWMPRLIAIVPLLLTISTEAGAFRLLSDAGPTIADIEPQSTQGLNCRQLVQMYLDRIEAYDKKGPSLNAIILVNPRRVGERRHARRALRSIPALSVLSIAYP